MNKGMGVLPKDSPVVVVGAGLGGAAAAYALACLGYSRVTLLEKEDCAGYHSSGRNAAILRHLDDDPVHRYLVGQGASWWYGETGQGAAVPPHFSGPAGLEPTGSWLVAGADSIGELLTQWAGEAAEAGLKVEVVRGARALGEAVPVLGEGCGQVGVFTGADGVVDVEGLLQGFIVGARAGGARVKFGEQVTGVTVEEGMVTGVLTHKGERLDCDLLINGAGAWAGQLGEMAGAVPLKWRLIKRHLVHMQPPGGEGGGSGESSCLSPPYGLGDHDPVVWHLSRGIYARPEANGVLMCPCDETPTPPCDPRSDFSALELLAGKAEAVMPSLAEGELIRYWAGIRTFSPDGRLVVGSDPLVKGFFWVAGLGGSGVGLAPALPNLILQALGVDRAQVDACLLPLEIPAPVVEQVAPDRFIKG